MVYRRGAGHGTDVKEDAEIGLEDGSDSTEEPTVRVNLLLIFLVEAEDDLDR